LNFNDHSNKGLSEILECGLKQVSKKSKSALGAFLRNSLTRILSYFHTKMGEKLCLKMPPERISKIFAPS
jgi:hypothetical protein